MSIIIKGLSVPQDCTDCACTNYFGGCLLVNKLRPDVGIEEYDHEWHMAHKEHRRMKYCPIVDPTEYEQAMIEEILSEKDKTTSEDVERLKELMNHTYVVIEKKDEKTDGSQQD